MKTSRLIAGLTIVGLTLSTSGIALAVPSGVPTGANTTNTGGIFATYFQNLATNCSGQVITGFQTSTAENYLTPNCSTLGGLIDNTFITDLFSNSFYDNKLTTLFTTYITTHPITSQWGDVANGIAYTGGNVAIGTNNLDGKLHVAGGKLSIGETTEDFLPNMGNWNYNLQLNGTDNTSIGFHDSMTSVSSIRYNDAGFVIGGDDGWGVKNVYMLGKVGIGTTTPDKLLHVVNNNPINDGSQGQIVVENTSTTGNAGMNIRTNGPNIAGTQYSWGPWQTTHTGGVLGYSMTGLGATGKLPGFVFWNRIPGTTTSMANMVIDAQGKVGIGTINPTGSLHIVNNHIPGDGLGAELVLENMTPNDDAGLIFRNLGETKWNLHAIGSDDSFRISRNDGKGLVRDDITIAKNTGNVGIGTKTPRKALDVVFNIDQSTATIGTLGQLAVQNKGNANAGIDISVTNPNAYSALMFSAGDLYSATNPNIATLLWNHGAKDLELYTMGGGGWSPKMIVSQNGNVSANGFTNTSDRRLKTNIAPLTGSLEKILSLNGYSFDWKSTGVKDIGVIAQEVETVFPEIVHTDKEGMKSVEYGNLVAPIIESIKTQQKEIELLKAEVASLKASK